MSTIDQVKKAAYDLRLLGIHAHLEIRISEAIQAGLTPLELLALLLQDECLSRKGRLSQTLLSRAKFRFTVDLEDWDNSFDRGISKQRLRELAQLSFKNTRENLLIFGKTGEGKTHIAIALGRRLCREGVSVAFFSVNQLFEEILIAKTTGKYLAYLKKLSHVKVLILDDFGLRMYSHDEANVMLDILENRVTKGSVIVTTQVDVLGWGKFFEDPVISESIVDRLKYPSQKIILKGGSYREKLAKQQVQAVGGGQ